MKVSLSRPRIVLMIGDDGVVVVPSGIAAAPFFVAAGDRQELPKIFEFIMRHPEARITLCADNLAQDYRCDTLPRLNFFDRAKLARRRLKQNFPSARLTASLRCKKSRDSVLMIGLHETNPVFAWADRLRDRTPDIVLLPVEGAQLAVRLMPEAATDWAMMISRQQSGGFRQIVTFRGDLVFTRLTPPPQDSLDDAEIIARDVKASLDYLTRHGLRDSSALSVLLLMPDELHAAAAFTRLPVGSVRSLSPFAAARNLALPCALRESDETADLLFAAGLHASRRAALRLMLPDARQTRLTRDIRVWGLRMATAALLIVGLETIWRASDLAATVYRAQGESARLAEMRQNLAQAQAHAAPATEPLGRLRQALERRRLYEQPAPTPWQGLSELAGGLDGDAKLAKLEWKKDSNDTPEVFDIALRMAMPTPTDRAATIAAFAHVAQDIARAMPDYAVSVVRPPYPALPQESVTAAPPHESGDPIGEILMRRKAHD